MKFKIGDEIIVKRIDIEGDAVHYNNLVDRCLNQKGIIVEIKPNRKHKYSVKIDEKTTYFSEHEIEHTKVNYTRLAEKMYPKGHRDGKYWVLG